MECREVRRLIDAYVDGELDLVRHADIDDHLEHCGGCRALVEARRAVQSAIRTEGVYFRATPALEQRVRERLRNHAVGADTAVIAGANRRRVPAATTWRARLLSLSAAAAILVLGVAVVWLVRTRPGANDRLVQEIVSSHIRSLMPGHLTDVPSSDQHTVKPWFDGKADFSPPVPDLAAAGFPLVGGRLDYVGGRTVAGLSYGRRQHVINVFVWPSSSDTAVEELPGQRGYRLFHWAARGYAFWAISDLNSAEMKQFVDLFQRAIAVR